MTFVRSVKSKFSTSPHVDISDVETDTMVSSKSNISHMLLWLLCMIL